MAAKISVPATYPSCIDFATASPAVSPNIVAAILITQKISLTSVTLLTAAFRSVLTWRTTLDPPRYRCLTYQVAELFLKEVWCS